MANVSRRRTGEFLKEVYKLLLDKPDGLPPKDILNHIGKTMPLTEYEKGYYSSSPNDQRFEKIIRFATVDLVKAGWLVKTKGVWIATDLGKEAYKKYSDPEDFYKEAARLYHIWKKGMPEKPEKTPADDLTSEIEIKDFSIEKAEETSWEQIKNHFQSMGPYEFQNLIGYLLTAMDYHVNWISPPGKDKGIDIIAYNDPLGTKEPRIKVQVKHKDNPITVGDLRSFMATLGASDVGIFVSSGGFTSDAKDEARTKESRRITLLDLEQFYDLWVQYYDKLSQDAKQLFPLKPIYFLDLD